jgi:putative endonuclease
MSQQWWVYMVETETGKLYTGISTDVERRFQEHCDRNSNKGAKFFRSDRAKALVFQEPCDNRSEASKREAAIKKLSRREKCVLIGMKYQAIKQKVSG